MAAALTKYAWLNSCGSNATSIDTSISRTTYCSQERFNSKRALDDALPALEDSSLMWRFPCRIRSQWPCAESRHENDESCSVQGQGPDCCRRSPEAEASRGRGGHTDHDHNHLRHGCAHRSG